MKTIVFYNWTELDSNDGGGVGVYMKNIVSKLSGTPDTRVVVISSGVEYDLSGKLSVRKVNNSLGVEEYMIVNSPVLATMRQAEDNFKAYVEDHRLAETFVELLKSLGRIDVIHFNNIEGLSAECLKVKEHFPDTKVIFSAHNYCAICPQVNLWKNDRENCLDNADCENCRNCFEHLRCGNSRRRKVITHSFNNNAVRFVLSKASGLYSKIFEKEKTYGINYYKEFINTNIELLNRYTDCVLAVSRRVGELLVRAGVDESKIRISYIGNEFSDNKVGHCVADPYAKIFGLIYLGPMRYDKGFYFLLDALEAVPAEYKKQLSVTFASRITDSAAADRIRALGTDFAEIKLIDGYKRDELPALLADKNLGVVPILWEDNLPQVTIEMVASGVPVLTGDLGGAKEIAENSDFVFNSGNKEDFCKKLCAIMDNRASLNDFYARELRLVTMDEHIAELKELFGM